MKLLLLCTIMVCVSSKYEDIPCSFDGTNRFVQPNSSSGASNVGKTRSPSRASDFGKSYSYNVPSRRSEPSRNFGRQYSYRVPSYLGKSNSHREPSDLGKSYSYRVPSDLGKSNSHREPSDLGKSNSHREPSDLGKSSTYSDYNLDTNTSSSSPNISCGLTNIQKTRVVGGKYATVQYLWPVFLSVDHHKCGGSIITVFHILTAAHCVNNTILGLIIVVVGTTDNRQPKKENIYQVKDKIVYEEYDKFFKDIAILVIKGRIEFNENVGPVCLPKERIDLPGKQVKILGWGRSEMWNSRKADTSNDILQEIEVEVNTDREKCRKDRTRPVEGDPEFCKAEGPNGSCKGDSGGPVVYHDTVNNRYIQVGLVSKGSGPCGATDKLTRFSDVYYYKDWIIEKVSSTGGNMPGESPCWV